MAYMLLVMEPHGQRAERGIEAGQQAYARMVEFGQRLQARGVLRGGESLAPDHRGVRVQVRGGQPRRCASTDISWAPRCVPSPPIVRRTFTPRCCRKSTITPTG